MAAGSRMRQPERRRIKRSRVLFWLAMRARLCLLEDKKRLPVEEEVDGGGGGGGGRRVVVE